MWAFRFRFYISGSVWDPDTVAYGIARGILAKACGDFLYLERSKTDRGIKAM